MASIVINKFGMKRFCMAISKGKRGGRFNRVSPTFLNRIEEKVKRLVEDEIMRHSVEGKTLR